MAFSYDEIDSNRLGDALRSGGGVELHLSRHRGKLLKSLLGKCPPAGSRADKGTKIMNLLIGVPVSFYAAAFHPKLMSVVSFYVLSKPQYEIADPDNRIFRFSGKK
jgi:hypothetical protein